MEKYDLEESYDKDWQAYLIKVGNAYMFVRILSKLDLCLPDLPDNWDVDYFGG